jgi:myo-inositol 2-dehydrogenase/D-chiro-inositol 1-dehydrogenase
MVTPDTMFLGFDAIDKVLASGVDVVVLATPPGFRPYHLKKCVDAGKHVFCEKPMATDASGCAAGAGGGGGGEAEEAGADRRLLLAVQSGGTRRSCSASMTARSGRRSSLRTTYNTGSLWVNPRKPDWNDMTYHLRNWYYFTWLSGDHLVEQAVHSIDKMQWALKDELPVKCVAHGGRQVRTGADFGHIFDHFSVEYEYASGARGYHFSRQQANCASDNSDLLHGHEGCGADQGVRSDQHHRGESLAAAEPGGHAEHVPGRARRDVRLDPQG